MKHKKKNGRKLLSVLLTLAMLVGLMPGMGLTAYADNTCTVTFKANGRTVSKEVTLPHTFSCNYSSENGEFDLIIKELYQLDGGCCGLNPPTVSGSTNVTGGISGDNQYITVNAPFEGTATFDSVYFDSSKGYMDFEIHLEISCTGAVAAYSVTITPGSNMTKTSGEASQTGLSGPMTDVVYTANEGYYFPENYSVAEVNGISVTRDSYTQITVSGTPTADAAITLTAPTEKTTPAAPTTAAAVDCTTSDNNDGKLTGVTAAMEYKKSDAADWTAGTGSDITGLVPGTYYVRVKATDTTNASGNQELTINAAQTQTDTLLTTITATDKEKASYNPENVASFSFSYTAGGSSAYLANWGWWGYGWTATVNAAEGYTITKCVFYDDANRKATDSEAPFVVETTEEDKTPRINGTPIDGGTSQSKGLKKIEVYGYATPAATHSVTITAGDHMTKTADSGDAEQTGLTGAMTDVVYTAADGYYFPTDYSVEEVNGISVNRDSYTQITVSGTPTADAEITLTAPTAKTTPDAPTSAAAENCTTEDNNDGKLTGVTTAMEYKKSDAESWTAGTENEITGLVPGTYYVRVKATETTNASANQELTIEEYVAATYDMTITAGSNMTKTTDSGAASQTGLSGEMTDVVYTAADGYYFPTDYSVEAVNGISVTRNSYTQITVSGTPTDNATITLTEPTAKTTPDAPTSAAAENCTTEDNNDGKLTGVTTAMEYKKSDAESWTAGTENEITGLVPGTYYVRVKATDTANASANQELAIEEYSAATYAVTITSASNMTKTSASGDASQSGLSGAMTSVVYTANDGYYFPTNYSVAAVNGISVTRDSYTQITVSGTPTADAEITLTAPTAKTTPDAPTSAAAENCTTEDNNDGKLTGVTTAMEYKKSDAESWTAGTGNEITGLVPGTYYVRVKATETTNASANQELTIEESVKQDISYTVTFKVVNGSWNDGTTADKTVTLTGVEGDTLKLTAENIPAAGSKPGTNYKTGSWDVTPSADTEITEDTTYTYTYQQKGNITATITFKVVNGSWDDGKTTNKTEILTGKEGDTLKLTAAQIPGVGTKPNDGYKEGSWDVTPVAGSAISGNKTYTYTYAAKNAAEVTKAPTAQTLTANGSAQELVTAGEAKGGTMYYAVTDNDQAPEAAKYATTIPTGTDAGTYYVWYKAVGDAEHTDSKAASIRCTIAKSDEKPAPSTETPTAVVDENGKMHVYVDGKEDNTYEGLAKQESADSSEDHYIYVEDGEHVEDKYGYVEYHGGTFLVAWGEVATGANGLQIDPDHPDVWYFCANGQAQTQFTGLAMYEDEWFWLEKGRLDTNKNALVEYNGGLFYVGAGRLIREVTGLCMDPNSDDWYFIAYGEVQVNYTGLIMYDGKWFYVTNGKLDVNYTGTVTYDGAEFNVINGMVY